VNFRHAVATYRGHTIPHFHFTARRNIWFTFSGVLVLLSLGGLFVRGLNYSIDFEGGAQIGYPVTKTVTTAQVQAVLAANGRPDAEVQLLNGGQQVLIKTTALTSNGTTQPMIDVLAKQAGIATSDVNIQDVGPTWGAEISKKAVRGLIVVLIAIALYITMRFEWKMAVGAMVAVVHDVVITAGIYALTGRSVTPETVIAILTILGFSLYDTVVIYDKIKENTESSVLISRLGYNGVVDRSLNQVLMRSVNTSLVVLLPILSLLLFGGQTLKDFAFAMFIGVAIGAYSSIFIAAPVLTILKGREHKYQQIEARRVVRSTRAPAEVAAVRADGDTVAVARTSDAAASRATARQAGPARPRPKSKRKPPAKRKRR
jgi:preprotein translocase subunit SecF